MDKLQKKKLQPIHQLLPDVFRGDAISNHARTIQKYLISQGYISDIFAMNIDPVLTREIRVFNPKDFPKDCSLMYHHSIGSTALTSYAMVHPGKKCLIYHNVTPEKFYTDQPLHAELLRNGRNDLEKFVTSFPYAVGDSEYNTKELKKLGFEKIDVLPIVVEPKIRNIFSSSFLSQSLSDGVFNILFVGRIAPNKKQDDLINAFAHYTRINHSVRLILIGGYKAKEPFAQKLMTLIEQNNLENRVWMTGKINEQELFTYFRTADLYWSMSEHEGFGVPLIESMWFDIPVLAYKSTAVPETLGEGGILFTDKEDLETLSGLVHLMLHDHQLRKKILKVQQRRKEHFRLHQVRQKLDHVINTLLH